MKKRFSSYFILLYLVLSFPICVVAQPTATDDSFPTEIEPFLKKIGDFVTMSKREDAIETFKKFSDRFRTGLLEAEQKRVIATCNMMRAQKLNATPYFVDFLAAVAVANNYEKQNSRLEQFNNIVDAMLRDIQNRRIEPLRQFLEFSRYFLENNAIYYRSSGATNWFADSRDYTFLYNNSTPSVSWKNVKLKAIYKTDSIEITEVDGVFFPLNNIFKANSAKTTWKRLGQDNVFVTLDTFQFDITKGVYRAEKARLRYPIMFPNRDIEGRFEDRLIIKSESKESAYPRFESYEKRLRIDDIGGNVAYEGGFKLYGTTVYGYGTREQKAQLIIDDPRRSKKAFRATAETFAIRKGEYIFGERVESVIYFGKDSIYHPSVNLRFEIPKNELVLERGQRGSDRNPFFDSYHQVNINVLKVKVYLNTDSVILGERYPGFGINENIGTFESLKFYTENDFRHFQNISTRNPISIFKMYSEKTGKKKFNADELAKQIDNKLDGSMIQSLMYEMASQGFITYDPDNNTIELRDKVFHFVASNQKKVDYDVLKIVSETKRENAVMTMRDTSVAIAGVKGIEISANQKVRITPFEELITLKKNRDFDYDGRTEVGYVVFHGISKKFVYNDFKISMDSCRFMDLNLKIGENKFGKSILRPIDSRIEYSRGVLQIDSFNNKSGKDNIAIYPYYTSIDSSYVFYEAKKTQDTAYKRKDFYFVLNPYRLLHLDSLTVEDLKFKGKMRSAGIFPEFQETLRLMPDSSLGFVTKTPNTEGGYPMYGGKGNFTGDITLDNKGFFGSGKLRYLGGVMDSKDIIFKPSEMIASAKNFEIKEDRSKNVPQIIGPNTNVHWRPYADSMYLSARDSSFVFFKEGGHTLRPTLILTPSGVKGSGVFNWEKGTLQSKMFTFGAHAVSADTMNMSIRALQDSIEAEQLAFDTRNIQGKIDFDKQVGSFKSNSIKAGEIPTTMPGVRYKTSIGEFDWDLAGKAINFKSDGRDALFLCIDPNQDSLRFLGTKASYDLSSNILRIGGVSYLQVCDAYLHPSDQNVQVELKGKMTRFENAKIVCDTATRHHVINRANILVSGRKAYSADGFYEYNVAGKQQEIRFDNIIGQRVGKGMQSEKHTETRATGKVAQEDDFHIDHKTVFKGQISLFSNTKNLLFEGYAKLLLNNLPDNQWFSINSYGDKSDLAIRYQNPRNEGGEPLFTGLFVSKENNVCYPRVMMPLSFRKDRAVLDARGVFKYSVSTDEVIFGDSSKILGSALQGTKVVFGNKYGSINAEGRLKIGSSLKYVKLATAGRLRTNFLPPDDIQTDTNGVKAARVSGDIMAAIELMVPDKILKMMANDIATNTFDAPEVNYTQDDFYERFLAEIVTDPKEYQKMVNQMKNGAFEWSSKSANYGITFSKIPIRWEPELQSFVSFGKRSALNSIAGVAINKEVQANIEFKMPSNEDDRIGIYIKTGNDLFYYFYYKKGMLSICSNNPRIEEEFKKIKAKDLIKKMEGDDTFEIEWADPLAAEMFARRVQNVQNNR